ncbi:hypothetical protein QQP08_006189 [Theobroma cacao]|nr:hypothetical protein QQP08_006189 [Theobroma cacao]
MASLSFTHFISLSRWNLNSIYYPAPNLVQPQDFWLQNKWCLSAKKNGAISTQEEPSENGAVVKKKASRTTRRTPTRTRKKAKDDVPEENSELVVKNDAAKEESTSRSSEANKKTRRSRKKVASASTSVDEQKTEKKVRRRRTKKKDDSMEEQQSESEISDIEDSTLMTNSGDETLLRMLTVQPDLITDKGYLECTIKYAIDCGVIDQWLVARTRGFPPREGIEKEGEEEKEEEEEAVPDLNGIRSVTEREYRTLVESIDGSLSHANVYCHSLISFDYPGQKIGAAMGRVGKCSPFIYLVYVKQSRHAAPHFTRMASQ